MLNICSIEMETHCILLLFLGSFQVSLIFFGSFLSNFFIFPSLKFLLWTYSTQFCLHCPFSHQFLIKFKCGLVSFWQQCKFWRKQGTKMWSTFFSESEHWALAFKDGHWCLYCTAYRNGREICWFIIRYLLIYSLDLHIYCGWAINTICSQQIS